MRYEKKLLALSIALVVLIGAWVLNLVLPGAGASAFSNTTLLAGKSADATSVLISDPANQALDFEKSGSAWSLVDGGSKFPAEGTRILSFLDEVASVHRLALVGRTKDAWSDLQLADTSAKHVVVKGDKGKTLADFYIGANGPAGSELFIRLGTGDSSYSTQVNLSSYVTGGRSSWLDLRVMGAAKEADVQSLSITGDLALDAKSKAKTKLDYTLSRDGKGWKMAKPGTVVNLDAESVNAVVRAILDLQGEDYVASVPPNAFASLQGKIALELGNAKTETLVFGSAEASAARSAGANAPAARLYARVDDGPVFLISPTSLTGIFKNPAELAAKK